MIEPAYRRGPAMDQIEKIAALQAKLAGCKADRVRREAERD